jgi:hypothetical protein
VRFLLSRACTFFFFFFFLFSFFFSLVFAVFRLFSTVCSLCTRCFSLTQMKKCCDNQCLARVDAAWLAQQRYASVQRKGFERAASVERAGALASPLSPSKQGNVPSAWFDWAIEWLQRDDVRELQLCRRALCDVLDVSNNVLYLERTIDGFDYTLFVLDAANQLHPHARRPLADLDDVHAADCCARRCLDIERARL